MSPPPKTIATVRRSGPGRVAAALRRSWPGTGDRWRPFSRAPDSWWPDICLVAVFGAITGLLLWPSPLVDLDVSVRDSFLGRLPVWLDLVAKGFTYLGQGSPLALLVLLLATWSALRFGTIRPLLMVGVTYLTLGVVLGMKNWFDRVAPRFPDQLATVDANGSALFTDYEPATSYPSGHAANAVVWYALAVMLVGSALTVTWRRLLLVAPPLLLVLGQTCLGYHWLSDAPAGFVLGVVITRCIKRVRWADVHLGPLVVFEPASDGTVVGVAGLLGGVVAAGALPRYGVLLGLVVLAVGLTWLLVRRHRARVAG